MEEELEITEENVLSLKKDLNVCAMEMMSLVKGVFSNISADSKTKYDLKSSPFKMINILRQEATEIIQNSQNNDAFLAENQQNINYCKELVRVLSIVSQIVNSIANFETALSSCKVLTCAEILVQLKKDYEKLPTKNSNFAASKVILTLKREINLMQSRLTSKLSRLIAHAILIENMSIRIQKVISGFLKVEDKMLEDDLLLQDLWSAAILIETEDKLLATIIEDIYMFIIKPLWAEKKVMLPVVHSKSDVSDFTFGNNNFHLFANHKQQNSRAVSSNDQNGQHSSASKAMTLPQCRMPIAELLQVLMNLFAFIKSEIFINIDHIAEKFMQILWSKHPFRFYDKLKAAICDQIPRSEIELNNFQRNLLEVTKSFDEHINLLFSDPNTETRMIDLTSFAFLLPNLFIDIRRKEILKHARDVLVSDYHNTMIVNNGDATIDEINNNNHHVSLNASHQPFNYDESSTFSFAMQKIKFETCQVSITICRLLKYVNDVLNNACTVAIRQTAEQIASPENGWRTLSMVLFQSARDCLEIFLSIIPVKYCDVIQSIPRMGAIYYNDCIYIAHNCILMTHRYRRLLMENGLEQTEFIGLIDYIPRLRKLAEECLLNHLKQQEELLLNMLQRVSINPTRSNSTSSNNKTSSSSQRNTIESNGNLENDDSRAAVLVAHCEKLSSQWKNILQDKTYNKIFSALVDRVLMNAMQPVLTVDTITEVAAGEISRVYRTFLQLKPLLLVEDKERKGNENAAPCANWRKFCALTDLLDCNLNDVADKLSRREFVDFTAKEMIALIKALFENTPRRKSLIQSITDLE